MFCGPVPFGQQLLLVLVWLLLVERRHVLHLVLGGDFLWLRRVGLHELHVGLYVWLWRLELYAGHMQLGPIPLWLELLQLLARLRLVRRHSDILQHLLRQHVRGLVCGLVFELPNRDELQHRRRKLLRNPLRWW